MKLREQPVLEALVEQIDCQRNGDLTLVPKVGDVVIDFGAAGDLDLKLEKLRTFYCNVYKNDLLDQYESIDLEYSDQIIAKRKN